MKRKIFFLFPIFLIILLSLYFLIFRNNINNEDKVINNDKDKIISISKINIAYNNILNIPLYFNNIDNKYTKMDNIEEIVLYNDMFVSTLNLKEITQNNDCFYEDKLYYEYIYKLEIPLKENFHEENLNLKIKLINDSTLITKIGEVNNFINNNYQILDYKEIYITSSYIENNKTISGLVIKSNNDLIINKISLGSPTLNIDTTNILNNFGDNIYNIDLKDYIDNYDYIGKINFNEFKLINNILSLLPIKYEELLYTDEILILINNKYLLEPLKYLKIRNLNEIKGFLNEYYN